MTREEKKQVGKYVLQMARFLANGCYQQEMLLKAVHIIDEALEQEPCEDSISRKVVLSKFIEVCFSEEWLQFRVDKGSYGQRDFLINYIKQLPSVTPQPETYTNIPILLHKEFGCPLDECVKAYEEAIEHLRSKSKLKG